MKIIRIDDIRIIYKDLTEYTIKTPLGVFKTVDDAIECYPQLKTHKNIKQCNYCGKYFIKVGKKNNGRKYCSEECSETYNRLNKLEINRMWRRDKYIRDKNTTILEDKQNKSRNWEFNQNDTFWGIGSSHIMEHPKEDEDIEHKTIQKEMKRLGLRV